MSDSITQRELHELLDRDRVVTLMNHYLGSIDENETLDVEWARSVFSPDVRVDHRGFVLEGLEDIAARHRVVREGWDRTFHLSTNHRIALDGDRAQLSARLVAIHEHLGSNPPDPYIIANAFEADVVRTPDGWRFRSFAMRPVFSSGQSHFDVETSEQ